MSNRNTVFKQKPRDVDITKYNSLLLYDNQGRKHVQQQIDSKEQQQGIRIVPTNQAKDTSRTLYPNKIDKEQPLFQNKKTIHQDHPSTKDNIFGAYTSKQNNNKNNNNNNNNDQSGSKINQLQRPNSQQTLQRSSSHSEPLNLFAPDNNPPVYSTQNKLIYPQIQYFQHYQQQQY